MPSPSSCKGPSAASSIWFCACCKTYEDAGEVTQEAFLAAWQGLPSFRGEARFPTWLYHIAYHCCLRQLERRKRERDLQAVIQAEQILEGINQPRATGAIVKFPY